VCPSKASEAAGRHASKDVTTAVRGTVLWVTINRPEKRNALSLGVLQLLGDCFRTFADDERIHLAVLTGEGDRAFAAGGDLTELKSVKEYADARRLSQDGKAALNAIRQFPLPVIARLNGLALGGGGELALACDMRVAAQHATIGLIHARLAITPSWGGSIDLMRTVGCATAMRLLLRAEILRATDAQLLGLVDHVIPPKTDFQEAFDNYIADIARLPRHILKATKEATQMQRGISRAALDEHETEQFALSWIHDSHWSALDTLKLGTKV
jgi:enoyl-CoA hydratase